MGCQALSGLFKLYLDYIIPQAELIQQKQTRTKLGSLAEKLQQLRLKFQQCVSFKELGMGVGR